MVRAKKKPKTKRSSGVTSHIPESVRKCEATPTLGGGVSEDSQNFRERLQGLKLNGLWCYLYC
jgi:hypothetical protein